METFTLTDVIDAADSSHRVLGCSDYSFDDKREYLTLTFRGSGYSVDFKDSNGEWCEEEMLYEGYYPLQEDDDYDAIFESYGNQPFRTHDYKSTYITFTLKLPPNRKRGDTYTPQQLQDMICDTTHGDDNPGMGFTYYNCDEA